MSDYFIGHKDGYDEAAEDFKNALDAQEDYIKQLQETIKAMEDEYETLSNELSELEMQHDNLDSKYEDVMWAIHETWPEVHTDLLLKGIIK